MKYILTGIISLYVAVSFKANSQCTPPSTPPVIACGTGTPLIDNANINTGQTYYFDGIGGSFSNISVNGGTLLLCGSVTLTNVNFNSGNLVINAGASVTFNNSFNAGDNNFYNYGAVIFNLNIGLQGANTFAYNAAGASITVNGNLTVFNGGLFINNGSATADGIIINSGAAICLGPSSSSQTTSIQNNQTNAVTVPTGNACVSYTSSFTGNNPITSTSGLSICQKTGASAPVPVVIGAAIVIPDCSSCSSVLPLKIISFKGKQQQGMQIELEWTTAWEENTKSFAIERSRDGRVFETIGEVTARNRPSTYTFTSPIEADSYFRLKMIDDDGKFTYSVILLMSLPASGFRLSILSNPVTKSFAELSVYVSRNQNGELTVLDNLGRPVKKMPVSLIRGSNNLHFDLDGIGAGVYYLHFGERFEKSTTISFIKL